MPCTSCHLRVVLMLLGKYLPPTGCVSDMQQHMARMNAEILFFHFSEHLGCGDLGSKGLLLSGSLEAFSA